MRTIDLSELKDKLLAPIEIKHDEQGWWMHPNLPLTDEDISMASLLAVFHIDTAYVDLESDRGASEAVKARYFDNGEPDVSGWTPTPPLGEGWMLLAIFDNENGVFALYGRSA
ncbi:hypothetical protein P3G55_20905 [Leptospira sp. 96542]|nr:hypothetical protein [Leptospira sp. 96542]